MREIVFLSILLCLALPAAMAGQVRTVRLDSASMTVEVDKVTGRWSLTDKASGVRWPSRGEAACGAGKALEGAFTGFDADGARRLVLRKEGGAAVVFELADEGRSLDLRYEGKDLGELRVLGDALAVTDAEGGCALVPCREGLLIPAEGDQPFRRTFGTSEYEGCHMNVLGFLKAGSGLLVTWDDAYVFPEVQRTAAAGAEGAGRRLTADLVLRGPARSLRLTPVGKGDWNTVAGAYRALAERKGLAVTLRQKVDRSPAAGRMIGAANVKLWTCLARRMNDDSAKEESVKVRWTFDEAARIAEHLRNDLGIERCLFMLGGWTEGGYDCRHPDNLPANPECGGNGALADAVRRIQALGYVACLHDNYQDMYRDARSWDPKYLEKKPDGSPAQGGRWLGGRAYIVCAPMQIELARRPQNLPGIRELFPVQSYFIDTTYAAGPRECHDPAHRLGRNDDIAWKIKLSDYAREVFGLFGSECGREWALPHSDFFEGLVGVSGKYFHQLDPAALGATVIPFWEMVYHDCQIAWGKYGYSPEAAAEYVAHHVLCARPLHYHSLGDHLYWQAAPAPAAAPVDAAPRIAAFDPAGPRAFRVRYAWSVRADADADWRIFVHFGTTKDIRFQDDHVPQPPTSKWRKGQTVEIGPRTVTIPESVQDRALNVYAGLYGLADQGARAALPGCDAERRVLLGRLVLKPELQFEPAAGAGEAAPSAGLRASYVRCDGGWAEGLHPTDVFLKNTQEVLGPLHEATAHDVLTRLEFLTPDRSVRRATYGRGAAATLITVNFGPADAEVSSTFGGRAVLPPWGFVVDGPTFAAFHAKRWAGRDYPTAALFTLRALDGKPLVGSARIRIFHGFGDPALSWRGTTCQVKREQTIRPGP